MNRRLMLASLLTGAGMAVGLSGCGMKPLYATDGGGADVVADLSSISIPAPQDRLGQLIRNDLLSSIRPAGRGEGDRYTLELLATSRVDTTAKLNDLGADRRTVTVNVTYRLSERGSNAVVDQGKTFSQVSYDETGQSFADLRARDNATERAAREVSQDIRSRLAAHFAAS